MCLLIVSYLDIEGVPNDEESVIRMVIPFYIKDYFCSAVQLVVLIMILKVTDMYTLVDSK